MSDWFFMLGEPLGASERELVREYLRGLGLEPLPLEHVRDFASVTRVIANPDWDRRWWDAEQRERERLLSKATSTHGRGELSQTLSQISDQSLASLHGTAANQAARFGCSDEGLIRAAAGALGEALYLAKLAEVAGEASSHPFSSKRALFAAGHWPLGIVAGHYYVF